jgi:signal peptidase I
MSEALVEMTKKGMATKEKSLFRDYAESIIWALAIAFVIRWCVVEPFKIPSGSMENTLAIGDHILVNKFLYGIKVPFTGKQILRVRDPRQGDVVVFEFPQDRSKDFIKRVIGVPGDVIQVRDKHVYVNGVLYLNPHEVHKEAENLPAAFGPRDNFGPVTVPAHSYFMMGDNRDRSYDSRFWGFVKDSDLKGEAFMKYWSWDQERSRVRFGSIGKLID